MGFCKEQITFISIGRLLTVLSIFDRLDLFKLGSRRKVNYMEK